VELPRSRKPDDAATDDGYMFHGYALTPTSLLLNNMLMLLKPVHDAGSMRIRPKRHRYVYNTMGVS
jgi:hypothetical protein